VEVGFIEGRGRSGFAKRDFHLGDFVCEYVGTVRQVESSSDDWGDICNQELHTGCYCLDVTFDGNHYVIDATDEPNHPGRCINHARRNYNLKLMPPVTLGEPPNRRLHIGLVATCFIKAGMELFFDYGIKGDYPWLKSDAKKIGVTIEQGTHACRYVMVKQSSYLFIFPAILTESSGPSKWRQMLESNGQS